jgi:hypothetical protein
MNTTIVIHNYNILSLKVTRIVLFVIGFALSALSLSALLEGGNLVQAIPTNLFWGFFLMVTSVFALSEKSPFSPKVKITDTFVLLKNGFWSGSKKLMWEYINQIEFGSYKITFHHTGKDFVFKYDSDSEVSIQIKKAIRAGGEEKNISVIGG